MFNKPMCIKFSEASAIKSVFPNATIKEMCVLKKSGTLEDIKECREAFPRADIESIEAIVASRKFIRWYQKNGKVIDMLAFAIPSFTMTLFGVTPSFMFDMLNFTPGSSIVAFGSPVDVVQAIPNVVHAAEAAAPAAAKVETSFFGGQGAILLHMLVVGFFTLVVSSFLKFTGRGDIIPLVAFVGGGIILYEVIGLFNNIYGAIKTLLNM